MAAEEVFVDEGLDLAAAFEVVHVSADFDDVLERARVSEAGAACAVSVVGVAGCGGTTS
jgi:hypothetical protein